MNKRIAILLISIVLFMASCNKGNQPFSLSRIFSTDNIKDNQQTLSSMEMLKYVIAPHNGLIKKKEIAEFIYQAKYKPLDYIISQEANGASVSQETYYKKVKELDGLQYFDFRIEVDATNGELLKYRLSSVADYESRVEYVSFGMQKDIKLIEGRDTLDCVLYHMERAYDITPYTTVLLGFKKNNADLNEDKTLVFYDNLFHNGTIKLTFIPADLTQIPHLEII